MKHVGIVLLNYNSDLHTLECLRSLQNLKWKGRLTVYVVNNASKTSFRSKVVKTFPRSVFIQNKKNLGFTGGNNVGINQALKDGVDVIMILNNDTKVHPQLANHLTEALKPKKVGIAVPKIYFYPGFEFHHQRYKKSERGKVIWYAGGHIDWNNVFGIHHGVDEVDKGQFNKQKFVKFASGCCMAIKREVIEKIGPFDDRYFLYLEDADFSIRTQHAGFTIRYEPRAILWHKNAESTGGSGSNLQDYFFTRNRLLFGFKYAPVRTKIALAKESLKFLLKGRKWQKKGTIDFYLNRFKKGSYPVKN